VKGPFSTMHAYGVGYDRPARMAWLRVTAPVLVALCTQGVLPEGEKNPTFRLAAGGLPADARFIRGHVDEHGTVWLLVESETFRETLPGAEFYCVPAPSFLTLDADKVLA